MTGESTGRCEEPAMQLAGSETSMYQKGHYGAALAVYAPLGTAAMIAGFDRLAVGGGVVALGLAMVPDQDQRVPGLSHRGLTHTVWFALLVGGVLAVAGGLVGYRQGPLAAVGLAGFGGIVGTATICSHVGADALTPAGVRPFAPLDSRHVSLDLVTADSLVGNYALLALGIAVTGLGYLTASTLAG